MQFRKFRDPLTQALKGGLSSMKLTEHEGSKQDESVQEASSLDQQDAIWRRAIERVAARRKNAENFYRNADNLLDRVELAINTFVAEWKGAEEAAKEGRDDDEDIDDDLMWISRAALELQEKMEALTKKLNGK